MYTFHDLRKSLNLNLAGTIFLAVFGAIYEYYSHGVYSYYMIYAFMIPLIMGVIPYIHLLTRGKFVSGMFLNFWNSAIATLSMGCVFQGVLKIYGTTNKLVIIYPVVTAILIVVALVAAIMHSRANSICEEGNNI